MSGSTESKRRRTVDSHSGRISQSKQQTEVKLSCHYYCRLPNGSQHIAEVIVKRNNAQRNNALEYYVHYKGLDRRMDEWIDSSRIDHKISDMDMGKLSFGESLENGEIILTRHRKRKHNEISNPERPHVIEIESEKANAIEREHEQITRIKYIGEIQLGKNFMKTWYFSPYPEEYGKEPKLYICEYCLQYMRVQENFQCHYQSCKHRNPPGKRIYQKGDVSVYEVDGKVDKLYCQNLCLLAKLFLDHKTLYYDVEPFLFYVMTEDDGRGCTTVGYFSKEKDSPDGNNVACILILPPFQRKSYGKFLIAFSYELSKIERRPGSPEKPLSDLGRKSYLSYWKYVLLNCMNNFVGMLTLQKLSEMTSITHVDMIATLRSMDLIQYWGNSETICINSESIKNLIKSDHFKPPRLAVDPKCIHWQPYVKSLQDKKDSLHKH